MPENPGVEDIQSLIARAADGDGPAEARLEAFGRVIQHYQQMAYGCAYAILGDFHCAEDAAQEAFLLAYRRLPGLRNPAAFGGWLRRIVSNCCLSELRRKHVRGGASLEALPEVESREPAPGADLPEALGPTAVTILRSLPEEQRIAMVLYHLTGHSLKEVAAFLETPVGRLRTLMSRCRARLRRKGMGQVSTAMNANPLSGNFADIVVRRVASTTELNEAAGLMHYISRRQPEDFESPRDAERAGIFVVDEQGKVTAAGYFNQVEMAIGATIVPCCRAAEVSLESHGAPAEAFVRAYKAFFKQARERGIHLAVVHGSQYDHAFCGFVPSFYYPVATLPVSRAREIRCGATLEKATPPEREEARRAFLADPHAPKLHPPMTEGDILVVRQDGQRVGYVRVNSRLKRIDSKVMKDRPLDYTLVSDVTVSTREAALAVLKLAGDVTAAQGRDTVCLMQSHLTLIVQTLLGLGGDYSLRRPCPDVRLGAQMACILDLAGLTRLLRGEFQDRLAGSPAAGTRASFSFDMQGQTVGFEADAGKLRVTTIRQTVHRHLPRWVATRLYVGYYSGREVLEMGPLAWDRSDGIVPDDLQLDNSPLTLPAAEAELFRTLFPKLWPVSWPDTDVWAWRLGQKHPPYYFGHDKDLPRQTKTTISRLRFPWLER